jgi:hypothetical protein
VTDVPATPGGLLLQTDEAPPQRPGAVRAWLYLFWFCVRRQARVRQMVWIALGLLVLSATMVGLVTLANRWGMHHWRYPRRLGPTYEQWAELLRALPSRPPAGAVRDAWIGAARGLIGQSGFLVFSKELVFLVYLSFLMPIWTLSFATDAIAGEREDRTLIWILNQPLARPGIYLVKFLALLPYTLGLNLGGFAVLCLAAGRAGEPAMRNYWPAVLFGTLAFTALFQLMGACFRRAAVLAIVYSFFLEIVLGHMPGHMKRISLGFYTRCMMFEEAQAFGIQAEKPAVYLPVDGFVAAWVLVGVAVACVAIGMLVFSRAEYRDLN